MAEINLADEIIFPDPENQKEQDLYRTLQDSHKQVVNAFSSIEDVEAITAGTGLTDTTNTFSVNVDDATIEVGASGVQIKALGVDTAQLAADAVDGTKIEDNAVDSEHIAAGAVDLEHMSVNSVDSDQYVDGSIDTAHIGDNQVTTAKLEDDLVFGTFPLTPSAAPDADYEVANKLYVDSNSGISEYANGTTYTETTAATERSTAVNDVYTKIKELSPLIRGGSVTITYEAKSSDNNQNKKFKMYIGGVATGAEKTVSSDSYAEQSDTNVTVSAEDVIQVYAHVPTGETGNAVAKNLKIKCTNPITVVEVSGL